MAEVTDIPYKDKEEKSKLLRQGNISLILEGYNDLFSDFDPRPNSERGLSVDFLDECKRAVREREQTTELRLLLPKSKRNSSEEIIIKKRLKDHFTKHFNEKNKEVKKIKKTGLIFIIVGFVMMFISYLLYSNMIFVTDEVIKNIALILTEPAGWFLFWIGGEKFVYKVNEIKPDYEFYKKMSSAKISFHSY